MKSLIIKTGAALIIAGITFGFARVSHAQQPQDYQEEITIIGSYTPTITDAYKLHFNPDIPQEEFKLPELSYSINPVQLNTRIELDEIRPANMTGEPLKKLYRNFVKLGYGNYSSPYFEFFINSLRSEETQFGLHLKHHSSNSGIEDFAESSFSNNMANLYLKKFFKNHTLNTNAYYKRNMVHYYGFMPDSFPTLDFDEEDIMQRYQTMGLNLEFGSNYVREKKFHHHFALNYYYLKDFYESYEHGIAFETKLKKGVELFDDNYSDFGLDLDLDYYLQGDSLADRNDGVLRVNPYARLDFGQYNLRVGFTTAVGLDTSSNIDFFPDIMAEINVVPSFLTAFAGFTGNVEKASFQRLSSENPFINSIIPQLYVKKKMEFFGGITGNIAKVVDYTIRVGSSSFENMPLFVNDTSAPAGNVFTVVYDDVSEVKARAELGYKHTEKLRFRLGAEYLQYSTDSELEAWHKPSYKLNFGADYNIGDKFLINAEVIGYGKMYARTFENGNVVAEEVDGWLDLNLGIEFRYTKNLSAFANFNNVGNNQYQRWYNYPVQKFNFLAGLTYSF